MISNWNAFSPNGLSTAPLVFTVAGQIEGSVLDSEWTPEFDMKDLKKDEIRIGWNMMNITIKTSSIVLIFLVITINKLSLKYWYWDKEPGSLFKTIDNFNMLTRKTIIY